MCGLKLTNSDICVSMRVISLADTILKDGVEKNMDTSDSYVELNLQKDLLDVSTAWIKEVCECLEKNILHRP